MKAWVMIPSTSTPGYSGPRRTRDWTKVLRQPEKDRKESKQADQHQHHCGQKNRGAKRLFRNSCDGAKLGLPQIVNALPVLPARNRKGQNADADQRQAQNARRPGIERPASRILHLRKALKELHDGE